MTAAFTTEQALASVGEWPLKIDVINNLKSFASEFQSGCVTRIAGILITAVSSPRSRSCLKNPLELLESPAVGVSYIHNINNTF
jgi:hypothetical protein